VDATRGRGGGMTLAMDPGDISVGALLRKTEADSPMVECQRSDGGSCAFSPACGLLPMLSGAEEAFFAHLDPLSVEAIVSGHQGMEKLVQSLKI